MRFLAAEKLSEHKYKTPEGYLVCVDAVLSRTGKQKYMRSELFGDECKNPTDEVEVDRLEADVFDEKAMASFENKPICIEHPDEDVNVANHNDLSVGFVRDIKRGTDNGQPVMLGTLVITDENAIDLVESGEYAELSCGYDCDIADDEHPTQRNIRGNHVALCKQGRAGIARIVDSVDDAKRTTWLVTYQKDKQFPSVIVVAEGKADALVKAKAKGATNIIEANEIDPERAKALGIDAIDDEANDTNDFAVMRFDFSTNIAAFERAIVNNDIVEFNAMLPTFEKDIADYNKWKAEGKLSAADVGKVKRQIDKINSLLAKSSINKRFEVKDMATLIDADYEQWTKQGWRVVALYKDGGRIHAIVERKSGDFVVALGYNTSTGEWAQGRYVSTFGAAVDTLNEEKPGAVPIRDCMPNAHDSIDDAKTRYTVTGTTNGVYQEWVIAASSSSEAVEKAKRSIANFKLTYVSSTPTKLSSEELSYYRRRPYGHLVDMLNEEKHGVMTDAKLAKKSFEVSFVKDGVTYVRKVKADDLQDAIVKAKDEVSTAHKVVVFTQNMLSEMGKNNSIGKYDGVISAMRQLYGQSFLPDDKLKEAIRRELPRLLKKYVNE